MNDLGYESNCGTKLKNCYCDSLRICFTIRYVEASFADGTIYSTVIYPPIASIKKNNITIANMFLNDILILT